MEDVAELERLDKRRDLVNESRAQFFIISLMTIASSVTSPYRFVLWGLDWHVGSGRRQNDTYMSQEHVQIGVFSTDLDALVWTPDTIQAFMKRVSKTGLQPTLHDGDRDGDDEAGSSSDTKCPPLSCSWRMPNNRRDAETSVRCVFLDQRDIGAKTYLLEQPRGQQQRQHWKYTRRTNMSTLKSYSCMGYTVFVPTKYLKVKETETSK